MKAAMAVHIGFWISLLLAGQDLTAQITLHGLPGQPVSPARYEGIKNSPYLFDQWMTATIIPASGPPLEPVLLNFNGYTQNFEVLHNGIPIEVELGYFIGIRLEHADASCGKQSFLKYFHPRLQNQYPLFIFNGQKHRLIKDFRVRLNETRVETPGRTEKFNSFSPVTSYFLMTGADIQVLRLHPKDILDLFPSPEVATYVKTQAIDLETEAGLCQLLTWWDRQP